MSPRQQHAAIGEEEGDLAERVAGRLDHLARRVAERDCVALLAPPVELRQPVRVRRGADHLGAEARAHLVGAGDVVGVVVGEQDQVQPPAGPLDRGDDRTGVGRIDDRGGAGAAVAQQPGIVVGQDGNGLRGDVMSRA